MAWQDEMVPIVRGLIMDMTEPYSYSDARLQELIVIAGVLTVSEVSFDYTYTLNTQFACIEPDPTTNSDADFMALVSLKTACMIAGGEQRDAARKAVSMKDGPSFIDTKERGKLLAQVAKDRCEEFARAKKAYQIGNGSIGRAIVGPYAIGTVAEGRFS